MREAVPQAAIVVGASTSAVLLSSRPRRFRRRRRAATVMATTSAVFLPISAVHLPLLLSVILVPNAVLAKMATASIFYVDAVPTSSTIAFAFRAGVGIGTGPSLVRGGAGSETREIWEGRTPSSSLSVSSRFDELFESRLAEFQSFTAEHGHGSVPRPYSPNPSLGVWAANLRRQHILQEQEGDEKSRPRNRGRSLYLTDARRSVLLRAGFDFNSLSERRWKLKFQALERFQKEHGHVLVPEKYGDDPALGAWVSNLRTQYRQLRGQRQTRGLGEHKDERSGEIVSDEDESIGESEQGFETSSTRSPRSGNRLTEERIRDLEGLGFVWNFDDWRWYEMLERLRNYALSYSGDDPTRQRLDFRIPPDDETNRDLRLWCVNQRSCYRRMRGDRGRSGAGAMASNASVDGISASPSPSADNDDDNLDGPLRRIRALESIGFPWSGRFANAEEEVELAARRQGIGLTSWMDGGSGDGLADGEGDAPVPTLVLDRRKNRWEKENGSEEVVDVMDLWDAEDDDW